MAKVVFSVVAKAENNSYLGLVLEFKVPSVTSKLQTMCLWHPPFLLLGDFT